MHEHVSIEGALGAEDLAADGARVDGGDDADDVVLPDVLGEVVVAGHHLATHRTHKLVRAVVPG